MGNKLVGEESGLEEVGVKVMEQVVEVEVTA